MDSPKATHVLAAQGPGAQELASSNPMTDPQLHAALLVSKLADPGHCGCALRAGGGQEEQTHLSCLYVVSVL